jgi:hypothetical protein
MFEEGKKQAYISQRLKFGAFLAFIASCNKSQTLPRGLTEGRFRSYWTRTDKAGGELAPAAATGIGIISIRS